MQQVYKKEKRDFIEQGIIIKNVGYYNKNNVFL